ncbi:reverse transcriptase [Cordyceps fumosorosea ARSEF 2679]|uniref:Reverse transcriptase n=1 Tax=Cordyceps fumosorosea (strain ARSEF 2679) TaxID=1081104 RepID=A0A166RUZ3_CORFA|nr:reverse transcriptase [Cordyceps fumosorosea ARSEF 2679]OAA34155.1 reverse transcriptase [Cordyceps fumosorosea ARSEF 2679]
MKNAFNLAPRVGLATAITLYAPTFYRAARWAYNDPAVLFLQDGSTIASAEGVRQGDPLSAFFWSLTYRPTLQALQKALPGDIVVSYLDDTYVVSKRDDIRPIIQQVFQQSPFQLNLTKSTFQHLDTVQEQGIQALRTYIGPLQHRRTFLQGKIDTYKRTLSTLQALPKQYALLLLRGSMTFLLRHLLRQLYPIGLLDLYEEIDRLTLEAVEQIASINPQAPTSINQDLLALPIRMGGLGITLYKEMPNNLYRVAKTNAIPTLNKLRRGLVNMNTDFLPYDRGINPGTLYVPTLGPTKTHTIQEINQQRLKRIQNQLTLEGKRALQENSTYLSRRWLEVLPTTKNNQLADFNVTEGLRVRLIAPVRALDLPCTFCGTVVKIGHEDTCKGAERHWKIRHDTILRALAAATKTTLGSTLEPQLPGRTGPRPDLSTHYKGSIRYYDLQIVAINKPSAATDPHSTLQEAATAKRAKYSALGPDFYPLIISAGGLMEKSTAKTYKDLQASIGPVAATYLDTVISLTLYKTRAHSAASIAKSRQISSVPWSTIRQNLRGGPATQATRPLRFHRASEDPRSHTFQWEPEGPQWPAAPRPQNPQGASIEPHRASIEPQRTHRASIEPQCSTQARLSSQAPLQRLRKRYGL